MRRNMMAALAVLLVLALAAACGTGDSGSESPGSGATQAGTTTAAAGYPVSITDSVGRKVRLESEPERIASMAPSVTETIFELGEGEKVVGVTTADDFPEQVQDIEKIGDFQQVNVEKILELDTDLLFLSFDSSTAERAEGLEAKTKADVIVVNPGSLGEILASMELVGRAVGAPERGRELEEEMRSELEEIESAVAGEPEPTVFYEVFGDPLQTVGPGSFIHDAIVLAGGKNIAAGTGQAYPTYSAETLIKKDPDYYLVGSFSGSTVEDVKQRPGYPSLTAVREDRVVAIDDDLISRPGPRIVKGVRQVAETLHPRAFE